MRWSVAVLLLGLLVPGRETSGAAEPTAPETLRHWIAGMKEAPRGPFSRLRWFCNDGTLQPPVPFACRERGGGVQHGEWTAQVKMLRAKGYLVANVLADVDAESFPDRPDAASALKQIVLEQFLVGADDGWIFRRARYYRGALQAEDEAEHGRQLLLALLRRPEWRTERFFVLREAVRFLPHGRAGAPVSEMRQLALSVAEDDPGFEPLRIKLHVRPEPGDAAEVRAYARRLGRRELQPDYERLAFLVEVVFRPRDLGPALQRAAGRCPDPALAADLRAAAGLLTQADSPAARQAVVARLVALLRYRLGDAGGEEAMLDWLHLSLDAEAELLRLGGEFEAQLAGATRRQRLEWLQGRVTALYGLGFLTSRERQALQESLDALRRADPPLLYYRSELDYLARMSDWAERTIAFNFGEAVGHLAAIEPLVRNYPHDRLRGSPLLSCASILDSLQRDAGFQLGVRHELLGAAVAGDVRAINPGLARGTLYLVRPGEKVERFEPAGIYLLAETTPELPPVAGILTAGGGSPLAHLQLLARNLGIPNAAVAHRLVPQLAAVEGRRVVLAVSPLGIVRLAEDGPSWDVVLAREASGGGTPISPDLEKLDLGERRVIPLSRLRSADAGRVAGPKAANLGELKHHFPEAVPEGLVIPFGVFRELLERPLEPGGQPVFRWLQAEYAALARIVDPLRREAVASDLLRRLRQWIETAEFSADFRSELRQAMAETFGTEEEYGVFVRSDTNVEDLPGFTGAGLNLTVPNVVGFDAVLAAVRRVWASPFSERAYRWRQAAMAQPEHVYPSVLLLRSVQAEKSGVLVTADVTTAEPGFLTVAVSEGVGGAVAGEAAEELSIEVESGRVRLLAPAAAPRRRVLAAAGGVAEEAASGGEAVLTPAEIERLRQLAGELPERFPPLLDAEGRPAPADVEFGFVEGRLTLFQVRPFLQSPRARRSVYLNGLDADLRAAPPRRVDLDAMPEVEP